MALHPAEADTIRAFVIPSKRARMLALLGSSQRRREGTDALNHFGGWDPRYAEPLPATADVLEVLRRAGAPPECHVIADDRSLDGRDALLAEAVSAAERLSFASVLCCLRGEVACFFDEVATPRCRLLLRRPSFR